MIEILSFPKINTLSSLPNIQLFGDAELDIVVLISHAVIVCICNTDTVVIRSRALHLRDVPTSVSLVIQNLGSS